MDGLALSVSIALQYGVPLKALVDKLMNTRFEPSGYTGHPAIPYAKSLLDYIARWLGGRFISADYLVQNGGEAGEAAPPAVTPAFTQAAEPTRSRAALEGAPTCSECGMLMTPNGNCYKCENCGSTSGCS